jgi:hypothetical protein
VVCPADPVDRQQAFVHKAEQIRSCGLIHDAVADLMGVNRVDGIEVADCVAE